MWRVLWLSWCDKGISKVIMDWLFKLMKRLLGMMHAIDVKSAKMITIITSSATRASCQHPCAGKVCYA